MKIVRAKTAKGPPLLLSEFRGLSALLRVRWLPRQDSTGNRGQRRLDGGGIANETNDGDIMASLQPKKGIHCGNNKRSVKEMAS